MLRLFVGLTFAADYRRRLLPFMTGVLGVHWQPEENLHMTLRFLGDVSMNDAEDLDAELARINVPAFDLTLQGAGWFGVGDRVQNLHLKVSVLVDRALSLLTQLPSSPAITLDACS